jgi:hypothetical protein
MFEIIALAFVVGVVIGGGAVVLFLALGGR